MRNGEIVVAFSFFKRQTKYHFSFQVIADNKSQNSSRALMEI